MVMQEALPLQQQERSPVHKTVCDVLLTASRHKRLTLMIWGKKCGEITTGMTLRKSGTSTGCLVWYGMVWNGMVWYGMVWYRGVWNVYGMLWYGVEC